MAFAVTRVLDLDLSDLATQIDAGNVDLTICDSNPASYADATTIPGTGSMLASITLGVGDGVVANNDAGTGRMITIAAQAIASAAASGTATHWALVNTNTSELTYSDVGSPTGTIVASEAVNTSVLKIRKPY